MPDFEHSAVAGRLEGLFRPFHRSDPNAAFVGSLLPRKARSSFQGGRGGVRAQLARVVSGAPEVMVKVTGRPKGRAHVSAHMDYIGRDGAVEVETRDGHVLDNNGKLQLAADWGDPLYARDARSASAVSMIFSMPAGTDPEKVREAVRSVARTEIAPEWDYVLALHTDTPRPHMHMTVAARGDSGRRFNPRPHDLYRLRERFAEELRARGVSAEATPRMARGVGRAGQSMALKQLRDRYRRGVAAAPYVNTRVTRAALADIRRRAPAPVFVARGKDAWERVRATYLEAAAELSRSSDERDQQLAVAVRSFASRGRVPSVHEQTMRAIWKGRLRARSYRPPDKER